MKDRTHAQVEELKALEVQFQVAREKGSSLVPCGAWVAQSDRDYPRAGYGGDFMAYQEREHYRQSVLSANALAEAKEAFERAS